MSTPRVRPPAPRKARKVEGPEGLSKAAKALFDTAEDRIKLRDGTVVTVSVAEFRHVGLILSFFETLVTNLSRDDLIAVVKLIEDRASKDKDKPIDKPEVDELVQQALGRSSLITKLATATFVVLPSMAEGLSDLPQGKFNTLKLDEAALVAYFIFARNWDFFSQSFAPILMQTLKARAKQLL